MFRPCHDRCNDATAASGLPGSYDGWPLICYKPVASPGMTQQ
jgi:hypothetical protein